VRRGWPGHGGVRFLLPTETKSLSSCGGPLSPTWRGSTPSPHLQWLPHVPVLLEGKYNVTCQSLFFVVIILTNMSVGSLVGNEPGTRAIYTNAACLPARQPMSRREHYTVS
jgi:hypothetical protein